MNEYKPPFHITDKMTSLTAEISEQVGRITVLQGGTISPRLRRGNRIRTIHSSLAIEHNSLSLEQVTAILDGKRVLGNPNEIREVQNAYEAYELMLQLDPASINDLLKAHKLLMNGLVPENGRFRSGGVGVFDGDILIHMAPPAVLVPEHIRSLFSWYQQSELHPLIKSAVFHYEFEFIHPFSDGNGRMGRMWHSLLLGRWRELFCWLPVEELIQARQKEYYDALGAADKQADCAGFVELMLEIIRDSLKEVTIPDRNTDQDSDQVTDQVTDQDSDQVIDQVTGQGTGQIINQAAGQDRDQDNNQAADQNTDQIINQAAGQDSGQVINQISAQIPDQILDQNKSPAERLLSVLGEDTLSASELMRRLGLSHKPTFRKNYLNPALEQNFIERTIPDKPNSRNQKYRKYRR